MTAFGAGWTAIDESGNWLPPPGPKLHPADAVRLVVSATENDGPMLAALISEHGWPRWCPREHSDAALAAEKKARAQLVDWLRDGSLTAWTERGDIPATSWLRIDIEDASTWWPVDAPNQGRWWTAKSELEALLAPLSAARLGNDELRPIPQAQLAALADMTAAEPSSRSGLVDFQNRLIAKGKEQGLHITRRQATAEGERLGMKTRQGRRPTSPRNIPE